MCVLRNYVMYCLTGDVGRCGVTIVDEKDVKLAPEGQCGCRLQL